MQMIRRAFLLALAAIALLVGGTVAPDASATTAVRQILLSSTIDADAKDWGARVVANGGTYSPATLKAVSNFAKQAKAAGLWTKLTRVNLFAGDQLAAALVPLKVGGGNATDTNVNFVSGDYTEATGLKGNGTSKSLDTGITFAIASLATMSLSAYAVSMETSGGSTMKVLLGSQDGGDSRKGVQLCAQYNFGTNQRRATYTGQNASVAAPAYTTALTASAFVSAGPVGDGTYRLFENGVEVGTATAAPSNSVNALGTIRVFAQSEDDASTAAWWTSAYIRTYHIGTTLTVAEQATLYTITHAFNVALGRGV
jgi:hypothetical protein